MSLVSSSAILPVLVVSEQGDEFRHVSVQLLVELIAQVNVVYSDCVLQTPVHRQNYTEIYKDKLGTEM